VGLSDQIVSASASRIYDAEMFPLTLFARTARFIGELELGVAALFAAKPVPTEKSIWHPERELDGVDHSLALSRGARRGITPTRNIAVGVD
jgi:hypothetical protein